MIPITSLAGMTFVDKDGRLTEVAQGLLSQLLTVLNSSIGPEGVQPPNLSSDTISVNPPAVGGQIAQVAAGIAANTAQRKAVLVMDQAAAALPGGTLKLIKYNGTIVTIA